MKPRRKLYLLAGGIVVVVSVYTGGWFYAARLLERHANSFLAGLTGRGIDAACADLDVGGYPLRIGLTCARVRANDTRNGAHVEAGAFHSAAEFDHPGHIVSHLQGPLLAKGPHGATLEAHWQTLRSSAVLWRQGLLRGDIQVKGLAATVTAPAFPSPISVKSPEIEAHTRQHDKDLDVAFTAHKLQLDGDLPFAALPASDVNGVATLSNMAHLLSGHQKPSLSLLRGASGSLDDLTIRLANGASVAVSGPFSFDAKGRLSGTFTVQITDVAAWQKTADKIMPGAHDAVSNAGKMLAAMADGKGTARITLSADHGRLALGVIPLGRLPAV